MYKTHITSHYVISIMYVTLKDLPLPTREAIASASGQGEFLKKRSVSLFQLQTEEKRNGQ